MKLGCMSLSYQRAFKAGKMDLESFIETAYQLRLDAVDLHAGSFPSSEESYLRRIKMACLKRGLEVPCLCISTDFGKAEAELPAEIAKFQRWVDAASFLGVPLVRSFGGWPPKGGDREAAWGRAVGAMKEVAAYAETKGIVVGLQNHNGRGLVETGGEVLRMLREVDHPYFSHVLDTGQFVDFYPSIEMTAPYAIHVRAKIYQIETGEEKKLDYDRIFPILGKVGYNGTASIVYEGQEPEEIAVPKAVKYLRRFVP